MGVYEVSQIDSSTDFWMNFHGPNIGYLEEQYEVYLETPNEVEPSIRRLFEQYGAPIWQGVEQKTDKVPSETSAADIKNVASTMKYIEAIRRYGHLEADIYPVGYFQQKSPVLSLETYGLTEDQLKRIPASWVYTDSENKFQTAYDVVNFLKSVYTGTISFEFEHLNNDEERNWLLEQVESGAYKIQFTAEEKKQLLERLVEVEGFENFLQHTFVGQKRFSIEGLEMMVPILDHLVKYTVKDRIEHIMMGMAHRGRLSVLAHVLGKPIDIIFSEFYHSPNKELVPSEGSAGINYGWTGDVKYHFGATRTVKEDDEHYTTITMAHNPSHLEFVNPIVTGFARAAQDDRTEKGFPKQDLEKAFPVLIHGDAAFIGEGIVAETLNLSRLEARSEERRVGKES